MDNFSKLSDMEIVDFLSQDFKAPVMATVNGFGSTMLGKLKENKENSYSFMMFCFTAAYIPIYMRSIYYAQQNGNDFHFLGYISRRDFKRIFGTRLYRKLFLSAIWDFASILLITAAIVCGLLLYVLYEKHKLPFLQ